MIQLIVIVWLLLPEWKAAIVSGLVDLGYKVSLAPTKPSSIQPTGIGRNWTFPLVLEIFCNTRSPACVLDDLESILEKHRISFAASLVMHGGNSSFSCGKMWPEEKKAEGEPYR